MSRAKKSAVSWNADFCALATDQAGGLQLPAAALFEDIHPNPLFAVLIGFQVDALKFRGESREPIDADGQRFEIRPHRPRFHPEHSR